MSDSHLMTDWICIATEGETVDKRFLTQQMLIDAAETYDPKLYTALLWPEHGRTGNMGEVLDVMARQGDDGLVKLYARLCPSTELINANRNEHKYLFTSVELTPDGNFRGTGRYYLEGLGVTDEPASVGTTRMRFNKRNNNYRIGKSEPLKFNKVRKGTMAGKNKGKNGWRNYFGIADDLPSDDAPIADDGIQALAQAVAALETRVAALENKTDETDSTVEDIQSDVETVKEVVDTEEFARLRENLPNIVNNFSKLDKKITRLPSNNPKPGRKPFNYL